MQAFQRAILCLFALGLSATLAAAAGDALKLPKGDLVEPAALVAQLKGPVTKRPLLLHVGFKMLYAQSHIPGSVYTGAANSDVGIQGLEAKLKGVPKSKELLIYCGCCPWQKCPNVAAAHKKAKALGYKKVKVLHIANNFGDDWAAKGYPVEGN